MRIIDCMPLSNERWDVVRIVEGMSGRVAMRMELIIRFDYGSIVPWVRKPDRRAARDGGSGHPGTAYPGRSRTAKT